MLLTVMDDGVKLVLGQAEWDMNCNCSEQVGICVTGRMRFPSCFFLFSRCSSLKTTGEENENVF